MEYQIGHLPAADTEPSCSLTITSSETISICMSVNVRSVH